MTDLTHAAISRLAREYSITEDVVYDTYANGNYTSDDDDMLHAELREAAFELRVTDHYIPGY